MKRLVPIFTLLALVLGGASAWALTLPAIFRDHMVLQRDMPVPVWGGASAGDEITVSFAGQSKQTRADAEGKWAVTLDALSATAEPRELRVQCGAAGQPMVLQDVLVGEVWLCSGQSNMRYVMGKRGNMPGVEHGSAEIAKPERPRLRLYTDDGEEVWEQRGWRRCGGEALARFSATAFFFGQALQRELDVPVGLINFSRGGTSIQAWTPRDFALRNPVTKHYVELQAKHRDDIVAFNAAQREARLARQSGRRDAPEPAPLTREIEIARLFNVSHLYNSLIEPLAPFAVRGVIWYQGESNGSRMETAQAYGSMLRDLIDGWRERWGQPQMPWYVMQLPCWDGPRGVAWPYVRQGQWEAAHSLEQVGLATICDVADSTNLHPPQKLEAGERLARLALARTYGKSMPCEGPKVKSLRRAGSALVVEWDDGGADLTLKGGTWNDVEMAGADGVYHLARAVFEGRTATVTSDSVGKPQGLRYGWKPVFTPSLFNAAGLPTAPFAVSLDKEGKLRPGLVSKNDRAEK